MSVINFATKVETILTIELEAWRNGEIKWTVSNQFNESVLESALENLDGKSIAAAYELYGDKPVHAMEYAHFLSNFDVPELASAWID